MRLLKRRSQFSARGPVPPWWRRPDVLAVVGLLVVGAGLVASKSVVTLVATREVREVTAAVRQMPLPPGLEDWQAACGVFGLRCAQSPDEPQGAAEAFVEGLRALGHDVTDVACVPHARIDPGTTLAAMARNDAQCTATASFAGGVITVAAWDSISSTLDPQSGGLAFGRTAVVVEWDALGTEALLRAEPRLAEQRFADVRVTPEEIAALPGVLADARCANEDADGCQVWEVSVEGPGEGRGLAEAWAGELLDAGFLVTSFHCPQVEDAPMCTFRADAGRGADELTRLGVELFVDPEEHDRANVLVFTA